MATVITRADLERALLDDLVSESLAARASLEPTAWATENATIVLPTEGRQSFRPYAYQQRLLEDRSPRRIVLKARQTGLSNAIAIEALHLCLTRSDTTILFVSRSQRLAAQLVTYCRHTINGMRVPPVLTKENQDELGFANGSRIISLPASPSTGRGFAATRVYLDEFAFCEYDALIYESIVGTVATGGDLTILSTPNGRNNMFFRLWSGLEGGQWSRHSIHWSDCPRYDEVWAERTRGSMPRQSFAQEYDLDFIASGDAVFDVDDLATCKIGWNDSVAGCSKIINAWDIGRRRDYSVGISIGLRGETWHLIEYARVTEPYPVLQTRIEERHKRLGGRTVIESNGIGDPVIENLDIKVTPFTTTPRSKVQAIQALQILIEAGRFKHGIAQLDRELSLYEWDDDGLVQDSVMAAAFAAITAIPPSFQGVLKRTVQAAPHVEPDIRRNLPTLSGRLLPEQRPRLNLTGRR